MTEGTRMKLMDEKLVSHESKMQEFSEEMGKSRVDSEHHFEEVNVRLDRVKDGMKENCYSKPYNINVLESYRKQILCRLMDMFRGILNWTLFFLR